MTVTTGRILAAFADAHRIRAFVSGGHDCSIVAYLGGREMTAFLADLGMLATYRHHYPPGTFPEGAVASYQGVLIYRVSADTHLSVFVVNPDIPQAMDAYHAAQARARHREGCAILGDR